VQPGFGSAVIGNLDGRLETMFVTGSPIRGHRSAHLLNAAA
jgi:hypothetical protein